MALTRSIGPIGLMFTAISGIMGSAWLFGPYYASQYAGPASLIAWVVGLLAMMLIALTFAELVCMLPITGGNARFIQFTHGPLSSFLFSWIMWLGYAAVAPVETMGVIQYLSAVLPELVKTVDGVVVLSTAGYVVSAAVLLLMCWINFVSVKWLARYNSVIVWFKLLVPILVGVVILCVVFHPSNFSHAQGFAPYGFDGIAHSLSVGGIIFSFAGYAPAIVLAGEARNPQKVVPLVLAGALIACFLIYLLLEVAFIGAQTPQHLAHGWRYLYFAHDASPFVGLIEGIHLNWLRNLVFLVAIIAPLGTGLIFIATSSRVAYAMSQNGYFPAIFQLLNKRGTPFVAVMLNFVIGMILFFPAPGWQGMVGFLVSAFVLCYAVGPISLYALRRQVPDKHRPFRLPCYGLWCFAALTVANLIVYWTGWAIFSKMAMAIGIGFIGLCIVKLVKKQNFIALSSANAIWAILYLGGMALLSWLGNYGGGMKLLPEHWDVVIVAVFSLIVLLLSALSRLDNQHVEQQLVELKV